MADDTGTVSTDSSEILVTVVVDDSGKTSVSYQQRADGVVTDIEEGKLPTLYNNALVSMAFRSRAFKAQGTMARFTNFEPAVKKVLKNGILTGGEFQFAIYAGDKAEGEPLEVVTNDANGSVSFDAIFFDDSNIGQTYEYTIVEVPTDDETVVFDENPIRLTIKVSEGEDHEVVAEGTYSKATDGATYEKADDPTFVNTFDTIVIHAVKRSREEPYDPLPGAHYGLWMVNPNGEDVYMGLGRNQEEKEGSEDVSSANGDLYYDLPLLEGVAYYFLEEWPPPAGHLVDPYPTDYFTLVRDKEKGAFRFVYEADEDFSTYCPDVTPRA
jgi:pilin isopeptide linkage protein